MARPIRVEFEGAVYHVISRGINGMDIFSCDRDKEELISIFEEINKSCNHIYLGYCV